ncbi:MAG: ferrous iron transport protein B [Flavobacteriia bacterium]|nr:ferrous iron transport protein B [Flavobacteriia bacterium]
MRIALFGNPNTGKSSLFNLLTGLKQKTANFPGVTVEKKEAKFERNGEMHSLFDVPGIYSVYPRSKEEEVVYDILKNPSDLNYPELGIVIIDAANLQRNLYLFTQLSDLQIPLVLVLNMQDIAAKKGIEIDLATFQKQIPNTPVVLMNARVGLGKNRLLEAIDLQIKEKKVNPMFLEGYQMLSLEDIAAQKKEAEDRYKKIDFWLEEVVTQKPLPQSKSKLDAMLTHPFFGYAIFSLILFVIFQCVFTLSAYPMEWIEIAIQKAANASRNALPPGVFTDLICSGVLPGLGGVFIFIPQIALLFFFIAILEETGYLTRVVFIMDRIVKPFGLNGRSIVPLLSSMACAIPGIMATRTIPSWKERTITLFVAPLMSCSARIPVFTLLISLVIPKERILGIFQLQGLVLFALYFLGMFSALAVAWVMKQLLKEKNQNFLLMELPDFKAPVWRNVGITVLDKIKLFTLEAGKIIVAISIVLWALSSHGPTTEKKQALSSLHKTSRYQKASMTEKQSMVESVKLEHSYIGIFGKTLVPVIKPLGYDWKIGIGLITSFAAREVFVGSMATIYAANETENNLSLRTKMKRDRHENGTLVYDLGTGISLMVFYVYALQCMSTLAVVKRETKSWKWPILQTLTYGGMAYLMAFLCQIVF